MAKDTLLVLSGGMDSVTMLYDYKDRIALAVTFQYGSNHNRREARCARLNCERLGVEWLEIDLGFMAANFESSLLSGADAIPEGAMTTRICARRWCRSATASCSPWPPAWPRAAGSRL